MEDQPNHNEQAGEKGKVRIIKFKPQYEYKSEPQRSIPSSFSGTSNNRRGNANLINYIRNDADNLRLQEQRINKQLKYYRTQIDQKVNQLQTFEQRKQQLQVKMDALKKKELSLMFKIKEIEKQQERSLLADKKLMQLQIDLERVKHKFNSLIRQIQERTSQIEKLRRDIENDQREYQILEKNKRETLIQARKAEELLRK